MNAKNKKKNSNNHLKHGETPVNPSIGYFHKGVMEGFPNYSNLKLERLKKLCKEWRIKGYSKKKKNDIINLLIDYDNNGYKSINELLNSK